MVVQTRFGQQLHTELTFSTSNGRAFLRIPFRIAEGSNH